LRLYVALRPNDFVGQFNLDWLTITTPSSTTALRVYEAAARLQPNDAPTHNNVGRIYLKRKNLDEATAQFREALKIDPDFIDAHNNLGLALTEKGDSEAATAQWKELIASANRLLKAMPKPGTPKRNHATDVAVTRFCACNHGACGSGRELSTNQDVCGCSSRIQKSADSFAQQRGGHEQSRVGAVQHKSTRKR
jgi:tetratricopeptide (TPR) repeat protein